jgi:hypothetical protein
MPMILLLAAPAVMFSGAGYYLMAVADLVDGAVALAAPAAASPRERPQLRVIQGGKF